MNKDGKKKGSSLAARILRMETFIALVGIACIIGGVVDGIRVMPVFFGACILLGSLALHFVKRKDWDQHWAEQERVRQAYEQRMEEEKKRKG